MTVRTDDPTSDLVDDGGGGDDESGQDESFAGVLRGAIEDRGLSLDRIRQHLAAAGFELTIATLSYWQSGRSEPGRADSRRAVVELERILQLDPGGLSGRLAAPRTRGRRQPGPVIEPMNVVEPGHWERLAADALPMLERLKTRTAHDQMAIGPDRRATRHLLRETVRAMSDGAEFYPMLWQPDRPDEVNPSARALSGCTLHRLEVIPDEHIMLVVLAFPQPLRRTEVAMISYEISTEVPEVDALIHSVVAPVKELMVGVQFHPDAVPHQVFCTVQSAGERSVTQVEVRPDGAVQVFEFDFGPGDLGLSWVWDPAEDTAPDR